MNNKHAVKKIINGIIRKKGRFPTLQEMCDALNFSAEQTYKYMEALEEDGYLEKIGSWYTFPIQMEPKTKFTKEDLYKSFVNLENNGYTRSTQDHEFDKKNIEEKVKVSIPTETIIKANKNLSLLKNKKLYGVPVYIVQLLMGIVGSGAAIISVYYTTVWLFEFLPWGFALLLSSIMVGFSISAFETIILFMSGQVTKSKISKVSITIGFIVLWIIVSAFSIMSTVAGQYNKHVDNLRQEEMKEDHSTNATYTLLKEQKQDLKKSLNEYQKQATNLNNILSGMSDIESRTKNDALWRNSQYRLNLVNRNIRRIRKNLNKIILEEKKIIIESKKSRILLVGVSSKKEIPNFYGWLAIIFKISSDKVQFIMSLFPAIFVDIIAPVGIALALFLRNKYKE
ncbi:MAG: hypothetical protein ACFFG0_02375 [Candidatus Thorarchaeota archaeon]